ncbi:MAG: RNA-binding transcriptional accessory protein [Oscillospiraceae bacterium]|nr:RNA-binding transcriptional accessory protein [Oscillospiraceae bacterium]
MEHLVAVLAAELGQKPEHVKNVIQLIDEGNTIPFIARYRKELHGAMDDQTIRTLVERLGYLRNLQARREEVKTAIEGQGKLTEELAQAIEKAATLAEVEDLYRPYKQKRRTRASIARERGLEPLARRIFAQGKETGTPLAAASEFVDEALEVPDAQAALAGASDIMAEWISEDAAIRKLLRAFLWTRGMLLSKATGEEDSVYRLYYDFQQSVSKLQGHQILAINRGEREGFLKCSLSVEEEQARHLIWQRIGKPGGFGADLVKAAAEDAWSRLMFPSLEREIRNLLTEQASEGAIHVFALNLKPLLMQPPVKGKRALGLDPAYRTGCKLAVVDETGKVLATDVIYPTPPHNKIQEAAKKTKYLIENHRVEVIAIGNGTASKESERFVADLLKELNQPVSYMVVSEAGASVYSASKLAAEEFPDYDVSLRSAVSIARRLQDPLAELVKIDPKAIGVGQYQHDLPQKQLDETLNGVVESCVNQVGVDLNTASQSLLRHVAGLTTATAKNIVAYREENGAFSNRKQLLKVPKLGPKAFLQCAGFLRVMESNQILDHTGVHPESYEVAERLLALCGYGLEDVKAGRCSDLQTRMETLGTEKTAAQCGVGVPTLRDIAVELTKPGRDPRDELPPPMLRSDVMEMKHLKPGMQMKGTVRNVVDFGAFVDVGVHQDGLVHISELSTRFVRHPSEAVSVGEIVDVVVLAVDLEKNRLSLSIKQAAQDRRDKEEGVSSGRG